MLTKKEKAWLRNREKWLKKIDPWGNRIFCRSCKTCGLFKTTDEGQPYCEGFKDAWAYENTFECWLVPRRELLLEAAEFEARVAAQLLEYHVLIMQQGGICEECVAWEECGDAETQCKSLLMKYARLQVEEEMDDEMDN